MTRSLMYQAGYDAGCREAFRLAREWLIYAESKALQNEASAEVSHLEEWFWHECRDVPDLDTSRHAVRRALEFAAKKKEPK